MSNKQTWRCTQCNETFTTMPQRHTFTSCPNGCDAWVDHEAAYVRMNEYVEVVDNES